MRDPLNESWDPADDELSVDTDASESWDWHARPSWGQRAVAAFPGLAVVAAVALFLTGAIGAGPAGPVIVPGTAGSLLVARPGQVPTDPNAPGGTAHYGVVTFDTPSGPAQAVQGSTALALPPYLGWEANGSAGSGNGSATVTGGMLHVGIGRPTHAFRGWFLTTTGTVPASCSLQFDASSPPPVPSTTNGGVGELVMAVQTGTTVTTGDINFVVVAEVVRADGGRTLQAGYSTGRVRNAIEHVLKSVPWKPGALHVAILTDGQDRLVIRVNGSVFLDATGLEMGITPPFQPYLEVQALRTAYTVSFSRYASVCGDDVTVEGVPSGTRASLGNRVETAPDGTIRLPLDRTAGPLSGSLDLVEPTAGAGTVRFAPHTYWPGDEFDWVSPSAAASPSASTRPPRGTTGALISVGGPHPPPRSPQWPLGG